MSPTTTPPPTLLWLRRDLRLSDHPGWTAALAAGGPVIPVFILDPNVEHGYGAAGKWRLGQSLQNLSAALSAHGSRLILRRGDALHCLRVLIAETGARTVVWSRVYDPDGITRDRAVKTTLASEGITTQSVNASLLFEPWQVETRSGKFFSVYTPYWRAVCDRDVHNPVPAPTNLAPPPAWPCSDNFADWPLHRGVNRGAEILSQFACVGETMAAARLDHFAAVQLNDYARRDFPAADVCSRLSENLTYGEISPRQIWARIQAVRRASEHNASEHNANAAVKFLKELVWREFAYHLMYHTPHILTANWRPDWNGFGWRADNDQADTWRRGVTGIDMVDAGMREMYVTGTMHNRVRMLVASFLTKHLLTDWRVGQAWFRECLIDWDPAANALGWQWAAGSGPDAAPYFRVFNPDLQGDKFDADGTYRSRFLPYYSGTVSEDAAKFSRAAPRSWRLDPNAGRPAPVIGLKQGRARALDAYRDRNTKTKPEQEFA